MNQENSLLLFKPILSAALTILLTLGFILNSWLLGLNGPQAPELTTAIWTIFACALSVFLGMIVFKLMRAKAHSRNEIERLERDIAHSEVTRECIKRERDQISALFDSMSENVPGVIFRYEVPGYKQHGQFRYVSKDVAKFCGHTAKMILSDPSVFLNLVHKDDRVKLDLSIREAAEKKTAWEHRFRVVLKCGQVKWVGVKASINEERNRPVCYDGIFLDISEQKAAEDQMEESQSIANDLNIKLQTEVARANALMLKAERFQSDNQDVISTFSHEIRTTINGVQGMLDMIAPYELSDDQRQCIVEARYTIQSLLPVINDMFDRSHLKAGCIEVENAPFNLQELVDGCVNMFSGEAKKKALILLSKFDKQIPELVNGDAGRIRQVLFHLIRNGIQHTEKGSVTIDIKSTGRSGKYSFVRLSVKDSGAGMKPDIRNRFFKSGLSLNHDQETTLGLPLSRNLVELMGGKLSVNGDVGEGTEVWFALRLEDVSETYIESRKIKDGKGFQPLQVLAAEDVLINQKICQFRVESLGHKIEIVSNGQQALEKLAEKRFDVVLMDCEMPIMDGFEATKAIRDKSTEVMNPDVYIVAVTAKALAGDRKFALETGMNAFISKPFDQNNVKEALNQAYNHNKKKGYTFALPPTEAPPPERKPGKIKSGLDRGVKCQNRVKNPTDAGGHFSKEEVSALLSITSKREDTSK